MKERITEDLDPGSGLKISGILRKWNRFAEPIEMIGDGGSASWKVDPRVIKRGGWVCGSF